MTKWKKRKNPKEGDTKVVKKFLWFPVCVGRECRWLETATVKYVYQGYVEDYLLGTEMLLWDPIQFIDDEQSDVRETKEV